MKFLRFFSFIFLFLILMTMFSFNVVALDKIDICQRMGYNLSVTSEYLSCDEFYEQITKNQTQFIYINETIINNITYKEYINSSYSENDLYDLIDSRIEHYLDDDNEFDFEKYKLDLEHQYRMAMLKYNSSIIDKKTDPGDDTEDCDMFCQLSKQMQETQKIISLCYSSPYASKIPMCEQYLNPVSSLGSGFAVNSSIIDSLNSRLDVLTAKVSNLGNVPPNTPENEQTSSFFFYGTILFILLGLSGYFFYQSRNPKNLGYFPSKELSYKPNIPDTKKPASYSEFEREHYLNQARDSQNSTTSANKSSGDKSLNL